MSAGRMTAALAAVTIAACAAPSRRLTPRVVEDPIVLPRRMASLSLGGYARHFEPTDTRVVGAPVTFRYGITDRLEWVDLLSLRYAILDDRPADGRAPKPLSLAVRAGVRGIGYSSMEGMIVLPTVSADVLKHVADRWALTLSAEWQAQWIQDPVTFIPAYSGSLGYSGRNWSDLDIAAAAKRQLSERIALGVGASISQVSDCVSPTCTWVARGAGVSLRLSARPWHWLTLRAGPAAGVRERPSTPLPTTGPDGPIVVPPRNVEWIGLWGWADFYW
jgi:hypothetical protein